MMAIQKQIKEQVGGVHLYLRELPHIAQSILDIYEENKGIYKSFEVNVVDDGDLSGYYLEICGKRVETPEELAERREREIKIAQQTLQKWGVL